MRIVFMGTPDLAVTVMEALIQAGEDVTGVFTQPDKPHGRKMKLQFSPVKQAALKRGISVYQPTSLRKGEDAAETLMALRELAPDVIVVAAYGQILPKEILTLPPYGCLNVHASLLPAYRGAAPIQHCLLDGVKETGVTIMQMAEGLDTGDMLLQESLSVGENEIAEELYGRLAELGGRLAVQAVKALPTGTLTPRQQDDAASSYASMIRKEMSALDFTQPAAKLHRIICALTGFTKLDGKRLKVYRSEVLPGTGNAPCGTVVDEKHFTVQCGGGTLLQLCEVQIEGGRRLPVQDFLRGRKLEKGAQLG